MLLTNSNKHSKFSLFVFVPTVPQKNDIATSPTQHAHCQILSELNTPTTMQGPGCGSRETLEGASRLAPSHRQGHHV